MDLNHQLIEKFVQDKLENKNEGAHTFDHIKRVYGLCMRIGDEMGADLKVLGAAALLHDIGRPKENDTGVSHSIISGEMSQEILTELEYDEEEIKKVVEAIRTHRFSEGLEPSTLEGKILSDVDKLDAIGAIGVFRAVSQAETKGVGIKGFLDHVEEKLLWLKDLMYTDRARIVAEKRHRTLESFVIQLREEIELE
ncbi:MAG: HD domain-containing protein [Candidatus Thorarchaeota archaeon]